MKSKIKSALQKRSRLYREFPDRKQFFCNWHCYLFNERFCKGNGNG